MERSQLSPAAWLAVLVLAFLAGTPVRGIDVPIPGCESVSLRGYYKNFLLALDSADPVVADGQEDLNRVRLMLEARLNDRIDFAVHYEHLIGIHPMENTAAFLGATDRRRHPGIWGLSWSVVSGTDLRWTHELDRWYVRRKHSWGDVTIGRQAIGWGVGWIWSPEDLFVAFSPVEIDREFRSGVDAGRALFSLGQFTEAEAVYAVFGDGFDHHAIAGRWQTTLVPSGIDLGFMGGKFFEDGVIGVHVVGERYGAGLHAEITATHDFAAGTNRVGPRDFVRAVVGAEYRFTGDVRVVGEYYFDGFGASDPAHYLDRARSARLTRGEIYNLGRQYLGLAADWEVHPLVRVGAQGQWNLLDPSALVGPRFAVSLSDEAQLEGGAYFGLGGGRSGATLKSEYGSVPDVYYLTGKVFF